MTSAFMGTGYLFEWVTDKMALGASDMQLQQLKELGLLGLKYKNKVKILAGQKKSFCVFVPKPHVCMDSQITCLCARRPAIPEP